jgi:hypothetical protein
MISAVQDENWAMDVWPNASCSTKKASSPNMPAIFFAFASGVTGSAYGSWLSGRGIISVQGVDCTHAISDDENWVLELLGAVRGKLLNRTGGPFIRSITKQAIVSIIPQKTLPPTRTRGTRRFQLDSERGKWENTCTRRQWETYT